MIVRFTARPRSPTGVLFLLLVLVAALGAGRAQAQYVLYHATHGDWTVTCARNMTSGQVSCTLTAPPPKASLEGPGARIGVEDGGGEQTRLSFRVFEIIDPARPVLLLIDTAAPVAADANVYGEGGWQGADARSLIDAMQKGRRLSLAWAAKDDPSPRSTDIELTGFAAALEDYRKRLAAFAAAAR